MPVGLAVLSDEFGAERIGWAEIEDAAQRIVVAIIDGVAARGIEVLGKAVIVREPSRDPETDRIRQGAAHCGLHLDPVKVAVVAVDISLAFLSGLARDDIDHTRRCVSPVQGALRAAQNLNTLHVQKLRQGQVGPAQVNTVLVDGDAGILADAEEVRPHTADKDLAFTACAAE